MFEIWQFSFFSVLKMVVHLFHLVIISYFLFYPGMTGKGKEYWEEDNIVEEMPACRQMFNIFHPFDPVAYRFSCCYCC